MFCIYEEYRYLAEVSEAFYTNQTPSFVFLTTRDSTQNTKLYPRVEMAESTKNMEEGQVQVRFSTKQQKYIHYY